MTAEWRDDGIAWTDGYGAEGKLVMVIDAAELVEGG